MEEVNALTVRNKLGEILDRLEKKGGPILISKGRKIKAVLVTLAQFEKRKKLRGHPLKGPCQEKKELRTQERTKFFLQGKNRLELPLGFQRLHPC